MAASITERQDDEFVFGSLVIFRYGGADVELMIFHTVEQKLR
jgi:hypothetical protein